MSFDLDLGLPDTPTAAPLDLGLPTTPTQEPEEIPTSAPASPPKQTRPHRVAWAVGRNEAGEYVLTAVEKVRGADGKWNDTDTEVFSLTPLSAMLNDLAAHGLKAVLSAKGRAGGDDLFTVASAREAMKGLLEGGASYITSRAPTKPGSTGVAARIPTMTTGILTMAYMYVYGEAKGIVTLDDMKPILERAAYNADGTKPEDRMAQQKNRFNWLMSDEAVKAKAEELLAQKKEKLEAA